MAKIKVPIKGTGVRLKPSDHDVGFLMLINSDEPLGEKKIAVVGNKPRLKGQQWLKITEISKFWIPRNSSGPG